MQAHTHTHSQAHTLTSTHHQPLLWELLGVKLCCPPAHYVQVTNGIRCELDDLTSVGRVSRGKGTDSRIDCTDAIEAMVGCASFVHQRGVKAHMQVDEPAVSINLDHRIVLQCTWQRRVAGLELGKADVAVSSAHPPPRCRAHGKGSKAVGW